MASAPEDTLVGVQVNEAQGASDVSWMRECLRQALAPAPSAKVVLVGKPSTSLQDLAKGPGSKAECGPATARFHRPRRV